MQIDCTDKTKSLKETHIQLIHDLLQFAAEKEQVNTEAEVSVSFVTNDDIQVINRTYRGRDEVTDVISFALEEEVEDELEIQFESSLPQALGDIIISVEKTIEQAQDYGHSFERELGFLAVHGLLHLLGYDHMNEIDEKKMFTRQDDILGAFGLER
ncbi:MAG TPA: rRNA maturation RNase YbeY [Cerasibacillus sp.]|uniref:rRNA maturation RNase YbeY n=1 Tax=Cerasibacillus sp. TaxID=2498711 RepID=UPI002F3F6821